MSQAHQAVDNPVDDDPIGEAAEAASDDWRRLVGPSTDPIEQLVDQAQTLSEVRDGLLGIYATMDVRPLTEELGRAVFSGRLGGDASIGRETTA